MAALAARAAALAGCCVVPVQAQPQPHGTIVYVPAPQTVQIAPPAPMPVTFAARLYPANDLASSYGMVSAAVTNDLNGRGSYINCRYRMNSATLGSGQCRLSNGAVFTMHVGS